MSKLEFEAQRAQITECLANSFISKIKEMGEDIRGVTWFSSRADEYFAERFKAAA